MQFVLPALLVLFVALKLTGQIDWSWWLVVWPLYPGLFFLALGLVLQAIGLSIVKAAMRNRK